MQSIVKTSFEITVALRPFECSDAMRVQSVCIDNLGMEQEDILETSKMMDDLHWVLTSPDRRSTSMSGGATPDVRLSTSGKKKSRRSSSKKKASQSQRLSSSTPMKISPPRAMVLPPEEVPLPSSQPVSQPELPSTAATMEPREEAVSELEAVQPSPVEETAPMTLAVVVVVEKVDQGTTTDDLIPMTSMETQMTPHVSPEKVEQGLQTIPEEDNEEEENICEHWSCKHH